MSIKLSATIGPSSFNENTISAIEANVLFISIKKLWGYLCYFFQTRKVWTWPQQSEVLIYDAANSEILLEYLKPWNPEILHTRKEQINLRVLLKSSFRKGNRAHAYIDCFIDKVHPRLIVTTIDNSTSFYKISKRHPNTKTLFVQNGIRSYIQDIFEILENLDSDTISTFFVDYMLVFGSEIGKKYSQYLKGKVLSAGSIKNNFVRKKYSPQPGVIAFIGTWRLCRDVHYGETFFSFEDFSARPDSIIIQCLMNYASENNKRLVIIPSSPQAMNGYDSKTSSDLLSMEKDYYRQLMGIEPEFSEFLDSYSSYQAVDSAEIVVALESTLGYESIARCKKTAFFQIRSTLLGLPDRSYGWPGNSPDEGPFWTHKPDPEIFIRILDYLFKVSDDQWKKNVESTNFSSLMEYNPENAIFQSILEKELGVPPISLR